MSSISKANRRKISIKLNKIVKDCQKLQKPKIKKLNASIESQMQDLNFAFDDLINTDLNPVKFQPSQGYNNGKHRISVYLADKNKFKNTLNKEVLKKLIHEDTIRSQTKRLSFGTLAQDDLNYLFTQNKRKFGEAYKSKGYSAFVSPNRSYLPSIYNSANSSHSNSFKGRKLNAVISNLYEEKLGIVKKKTVLAKKKTLDKKKRKYSMLSSSLNECEAMYLNPEFFRDNQNVANKLKVEKIVVKQHEKEVKSSFKAGKKNK